MLQRATAQGAVALEGDIAGTVLGTMIAQNFLASHGFAHGDPGAADRALARRLAAQVHGVVNSTKPLRNFVLIGPSYPPEHVRISPFRHGYVLELGTRIAKRLAADPHALRYRF